MDWIDRRTVHKMSKKDRFYMCIHAPCSFKTDKRKAIYTHLVRTHNERKEDYECEYCSCMFELDSEIERHLHVHHPQQPFTYTCVSRIEKVISNCAKLGTDSKRSQTAPPVKPANDERPLTTKGSTEKKISPKCESVSPISKPPYLKPNISMRTRASVNESLNNIAKLPKYGDPDEQMTPGSNYSEEDMYADSDEEEMEEVEIDSEEESPTYISKPSGLKIKLSLKKSTGTDSREVSSERSSSPPLLEPSMTHAANDTDPSDLPDEVLPDIAPNNTVGIAVQVRVKDSKYYDKLEVYHHTDEFGRRCCPFCDYKTMKNTIRVHLSGIHKIHFVKCSLCDYKAAFPHQITQHGMKFHKTTNLNVIQLSKESRDKTIAQLKKLDTLSTQVSPSQSNSISASKAADDTVNRNEIVDDEDFNSEESYPTSADENESSANTADDRIFKPPKCQTSKTDYYSIRVENGVYLYSCNLCTFQTPVRATIYTHKYRHEEKSYRCGYCDFTSAPRSNVVHHCRVRHKNSPVNVVETDANDAMNAALTVHDETGSEISAIKSDEFAKSGTNIRKGVSSLKTVNAAQDNTQSTTKYQPTIQTPEKSHQTIIKVPQFKRSITSGTYDTDKSSEEAKRPKIEPEQPGVEYKLSLNKLYRINPTGSPKFMCALCSYACDTHPKMKHHLYRHRPQKYKCPYCDHRKYPRSYVVRHVRDTHRNKPVRVIDLSKGEEPEDIPDYTNEGVADDTLDDTAEIIDTNEADQNQATKQTTIKQEVDTETIQAVKSDVFTNAAADDMNTEQNDEVNALKNFAEKLNLRSVLTTELNDDIFMQSPDVSPNFSDAVYTSTPLIESFINGQYQNTDTPKSNSKNFEKKKSLKDYRVNYGQGPRYICNKCGYGTENYKTIHNHMYRHESQRYQCPYCGYRRSPKSFVENHIREVHKGHPVIVTELTVDQEMNDTPVGSPRQCVTLKRKEPATDSPALTPTLTVPTKVQKVEEQVSAKGPMKWPAPKPVSQIDLTPTHGPTSDQKSTDAISSPAIFTMNPNDLQNSTTVLKSPTLVLSAQATKSPGSTPGNNPVRFVERNRTTYKTMYKCVFDPETCNHISKDKSKMKQHLFMHVEYKPWSCDFCDMTASQSSHIKNHVRTEHPGVIETSFKYKRHNYLEKHIESFLTKGLLTVPVNEYRAIMDMKGNTKSSKQLTFERDEEGNFVLCPYCNYKTKSGGMTDHVKMKHMQPRFKCHWCDYRAFYRSEIRKHHRKEKTHAGLDFKTQELDLVQVMEGFKEKNGDNFGAAINVSSVTASSSVDPSRYLGEEDEDDDDDVDKVSDCSSSEGSSIGEYQEGYVEYTTEQLTEFCTNRQSRAESNIGTEIDKEEAIDIANKQTLFESLNTEVGPDGSMKIVQKPKSDHEAVRIPTFKESKFKCGYCSFSAELRVKVKMHCSKKHTRKVCKIIDPSAKSEQNLEQKNLDLDASDWKGTKFEQDLRKAGVSKLNLASLFPNSKRFQKSNLFDTELQEQSQNDEENAEFKKPLEPVSRAKVSERKSESFEIKDKLTVNNSTREISMKTSDNHDITGPLVSTSANDKDIVSSDILISDVRSLNQGENNESNNCNYPQEIKTESVDPANDQEEQNECTHTDGKLKNTFPNCTAVILEKDEQKFETVMEADIKSDDVAVESENKVENTNNLETEETEKKGNALNIEYTGSQKTGHEPDQEYKHENNVAAEDSENNHDKICSSDDLKDNTTYSERTEDNCTSETLSPKMNLVNSHIFAIDGTLKETANMETNENIIEDDALSERVCENDASKENNDVNENTHESDGAPVSISENDTAVEYVRENNTTTESICEDVASNIRIREEIQSNENICEDVGSNENICEDVGSNENICEDVGSSESICENNLANNNFREKDEVRLVGKNTEESLMMRNVKLDGTCDGIVEKIMTSSTALTDSYTLKNSTVIDLPINNGNTCAMKEICEET